MIGDVFKAIMQVSDPKFLSVFIRGVGMTVLLLLLSTIALLSALPNSISVPWFGELVCLTSFKCLINIKTDKTYTSTWM